MHARDESRPRYHHRAAGKSVRQRCAAWIHTQRHRVSQSQKSIQLYLLHARLRVLPEFYLRYGVMNFLRAVKIDRAIVWPMIKASAWFVVNAPAFSWNAFEE